MLRFPRVGRRTNPDYGLRYFSNDGRYELYESDQLGGVPLAPVRWIAVRRDETGGRVIGRHRCRQAAERRCVQDAARLDRLARRAEREAERKAKRRKRLRKLRRVAAAK